VNVSRLVFRSVGTVAIALCFASCASPGTPKAAVTSLPTVPPPMTTKMVPGVPTLGQAVGDFFDGQGFGQVRPTRFFNGGDPTGLVTAVTWNSWGGPTAVGTGTGYWEGAGTQPVKIEAFDRETCQGKPMYGAVEWYFPEHGEHLDPKNYEDICTGQYVDLTCLSYVQATALLQSQPSTQGDVASGVICEGSSWATAGILTKYFNTTGEGIPIGSATFNRERGRQWVVTASFIHRNVRTLNGPPAAYCRTLARKGAPTTLRCSPTTTQPYPAGRPDW
jgi:hypothetical protein